MQGELYKTCRNWENLQRAKYAGVGEFDIPRIFPDNPTADNWIGFNYAKGCEEPEKHGVHFFVDDYQFLRVWDRPDTYIPMLRKFQAVCSPDFSMFTDFPKAVNVYNHYRKHWLGAYWQEHGVRVIPTIGWVDEDSFEWCFDGEPIGGTVAVSSVGTQGGAEAKAYFLRGFNEMSRRLNPQTIVFYGTVPPELKDDERIIHVVHFAAKWDARKAAAKAANKAKRERLAAEKALQAALEVAEK